jgi:2C-methyl-D-erythritol 2,4-cyclodiphosphate synthase
METILPATRENQVLKDEVKRLKIELGEAKRRTGRFQGDILMHSVVDALLHQAASISALILDQDRYSRSRNLRSVIK